MTKEHNLFAPLALDTHDDFFGNREGVPGAMLKIFNELSGTRIKLQELAELHRGKRKSVPPDRQGEIHQQIWQLLRFFINNLTVPERKEQALKKSDLRRIRGIIQNIAYRISMATMRVETPEEAFTELRTLEERSSKAYEISRLLGPKTLSCAERVKEQMYQMGHTVSSKIDLHALVKEVWEAYAVEIENLHEEITDPEIATAIYQVYKALFREMGVPFYVVKNLRNINDPRRWLCHFYRNMGVYIFINLLNQNIIENPPDDASSEVLFLQRLRNNDGTRISPGAGISFGIPFGVNMPLWAQEQLPDVFTRVTGIPHSARGAVEVIASFQQARITEETQLDKLKIRIAASCDGQPGNFTFGHTVYNGINAHPPSSIKWHDIGFALGPVITTISGTVISRVLRGHRGRHAA